MRFSKGRIAPICLMLVSVTIVASGCSRGDHPRAVPAGGTVTYRGSPVEGASVMFAPWGGGKEKAATATTDAAGKFRLSTFGQDDGAVPGQYKVTVFKPADSTDLGDIENQVDEKKVAMQAAGLEIPESEAAPLLPPKYSSIDTTLLDATVKEDSENQFPFDLQD